MTPIEARLKAIEGRLTTQGIINATLRQQLAAALQAIRNIEPAIPGSVTTPTGASSLAVARVTTAITPVSGTTAGTGVVTIQFFNGTVYADTGTTGVNVYNYHDKTIAVNARVGLIQPTDGYWQVIDVDLCSNLS